ncbi:hypothetical protein DF3PB_4410003 [uncultured Defluviicoccus sp.]|uniref:Uncharacterized protein n=1 Tax=metagenome TaxID=256318 RepID=A0A380TGA0_9ZZZZ|nr:hypothetical protein DF3PB_4410003 [uncultured Defluviicoccus sp.]
MTLVNYEFYAALRSARAPCPDHLATAAAAAVLHRPFTRDDAEVVRIALEAAGCPADKAALAAAALVQDLRQDSQPGGLR